MSLLGTTPFTVTYIDGRTESLPLRDQLSNRDLYKFIKHVGAEDTPALVALCADKPLEWVDLLRLDSFRALAAECIRRNFPPAMGQIEGDPIAGAMLLPFLQKLSAAQTVANQFQPPPVGMPTSPASSATSPAPASSVSAAATGIAA